MLDAVSDLLSSLPQDQDHQLFAFIDLGEDDRLAEGFAEAAEATFDRWKSEPRLGDKLLLPMIYNYRHALELALKQAIRDAAVVTRVDVAVDPWLQPGALNEHLKYKKGHRLEPLGRMLADLLARIGLEGLPQGTTSLLARLHQLDKTGEAFRYSGYLKTQAYAVNVPALIEFFREAFGVIHGGVLTMLHEYASHQQDMFSEYHVDDEWAGWNG